MSQYVVKDVADLVIVDYVTNKPFLSVDYAEVTSIDGKSNHTEIRGGKGAFLLSAYDHEKTSSMKLTLPLIDLKAIALSFGSTIAQGAKNVYKQEVLTVSASNTVTLAATPNSGTLYVYQLSGQRDYGTEITVGTPATTPNNYSIAGGVITLNATSNPQSSQVIAFYQYAAPSTSQTLTLPADKFPTAVKIYGDAVWVDQVTNQLIPVKMNIYNAKFQANSSLSLDMKNPAKLDLTVDLYAVPDSVNGGYKYMDYVLLT